MSGQIKFKAWHKKLNCFFSEIAIYNDGSIGMDLDEFESSLPEKFVFDGEEVTAKDNENDDFRLTINTGEEWIFLDAEDVELIRFAEIKDKNESDIYDGDILKVGTKHGFNSDLLNEFARVNNLDTINGIGLHFTGIVRVDLLRGLMFENPKNGYQEPMFTRLSDIRRNHSDIEKIGNIYQNSELLNA